MQSQNTHREILKHKNGLFLLLKIKYTFFSKLSLWNEIIRLNFDQHSYFFWKV